MRIVHISDIHIRNFKYHREYELSFQELYRQIDALKPDVVINTGDTVHAKTQITPELVDILARHVRSVAEIAPYRVILGNHDLNLKNLDRRDAVSPIIHPLRESGIDVDLWTTTGPYSIGDIDFYVYPIDNEELYPTKDLVRMKSGDTRVRVGLFHGSISGCKTDADWIMSDLEHDVSLFDDFDYVLMGDIHKHQSWRGGRVCYAGSLIQQNFGEAPDKGFVVWDIDSREKFQMRHVHLKTPLSFHTIRVGQDMIVPSLSSIPMRSYIRVVTDSSFTSAEQRKIVSSAREAYDASDVIVVNSTHSAPTIVLDSTDGSNNPVDFSEKHTQEKLLREYLSSRDMTDDEIERIVAIDRAIQTEIAADEDHAQGRHWKVNKILWSNFCQYGEDNAIDLLKVSGVYGIFGQNNAGKSTVFELITEGLFDRVTKDVPRNIDLINDDKDGTKIVIDISVDGRDYIIERDILRVTQKKKEQRDWGKMSLDFYEVKSDGEKVLLNGDTRPETERAIRRLLGGFDEFCLTAMSPQHSVIGLPGGGDIINCKDTDRRKLLYRFLGLDVFEKKLTLARDTLKTLQLPPPISNVEEDERKLAEMQTQLHSCESELDVVSIRDSDISVRKATLQGSLDVIKSRLNTLKISEYDIDTPDEVFSHVESIKKTIARLEDDLKRESDVAESLRLKAEELDALCAAEPDDPTGEIRRLSSDISAMNVSLTKLNERKLASEKKISILQTVPCGNSFPSCRFLTDAFEAKGDIERFVSESDSLSHILMEAEAKLDSLREKEVVWQRYCSIRSQHTNITRSLSQAIDRVRSIEKRLNSSRESLADLNSSHDRAVSVKDEISQLKSIRSELIELERLSKTVRSELFSLRDMEQKLSSKVAVLSARVSSMKADLEKRRNIERDRTLLEAYCQAVGKDGVPRSVLIDALPNISREINQIISAVSGMTVSLESDEEEQSLSLTISSKSGRPRPISLSGGADKFIASLAIRAALCRITSLPRPNMFIVDEGFGKLDSENSQSIQRMFQYLRGMFDHIIIVSHTETMRDMVDGTIDIGVDSEGFAHIEHV